MQQQELKILHTVWFIFYYVKLVSVYFKCKAISALVKKMVFEKCIITVKPNVGISISDLWSISFHAVVVLSLARLELFSKYFLGRCD